MTKRMLVDATHPEETRVAIVESYRDTNRLEDLDFGLASKPILRGNIYLAKVMRIEPSLQAAFVEYGGNRHGFLPFSEIHPDYFRIPMADRPADEEDMDGEDEASEESYPSEEGYLPDEGESADEDSRASQDESDESRPDEASEPAEAYDSSENLTSSDETSSVSMPVSTATSPTLAATEAPLEGFTASVDVGLITDFGNAALPMEPPADLPPPEPVESVGGEITERYVRQHRPRYKIQEVLKRGQVMLIQVVKEERGNKGAALTSFLSLAGRYCVLMPNTDHGGGVSRKITNHQDRRRMKEILDQLEIPEGMAVILRTAGMEQEPPEIQRDLEYLLRLWDNIREQTLRSTAPSLIYEEANLIKRSVRDLFSRNINEILVAGEEGYQRARDFMCAIMPDQVEKIRLYNDPIPLFFRYQVENQIDTLHSPVVQLRSGGYLVINPTEALVSIDVNSGRATRERHIEETALKTNLEAADEVARQLRLRDLAGLVVIDFIDMEDGRNNAAVERRLKEAMKNDRARLQIGRISAFGLLELSRQRLRPSLLEINFEKCPHCAGVGFVRSVDSAALSVLRAIEEEGIRQRATELVLHVPTRIALYILNQKRATLSAIEQRYDLHVLLHSDDALVPPDYRLERVRTRSGRPSGPAVNMEQVLADVERSQPVEPEGEEAEPSQASDTTERAPSEDNNARRRRFRGGRDRRDNRGRKDSVPSAAPSENDPAGGEAVEAGAETPRAEEGSAEDRANQNRRRRGRRGGRRRNGNGDRLNERSGGGPRNAGPREATPENHSVQVVPPPALPLSIHDIDTTPRAYKTPSSHPAPTQTNSGRPARSESGSSAPPSYEVVNPPADSPKGGWWRRLTGV